MKKFIFDLQRFKEIENANPNKLLVGTDNADTIKNSGSMVTITGYAGNDSINNSGEMVNIVASSGDNYIYNIGSQVTISTGDGDDYFQGYASKVLVSTGGRDDRIIAPGSEVTITAGEGNDYIDVGSISDYSEHIFYTYGDGEDTIKSFNTRTDTLYIETEKAYSTIKSESSNNFYITFDNDNSIVLQNYYGDIDNLNLVVTRTYSGGSQTVGNYESGQKLNWSTDLTGINIFSGDNFIMNSSTGNLTIQNARDKVIDISVNNQTIAYAAMASGELTLDASGLSQFLILVGGNHASNNFTAGSGGSWLWGGSGGYDTLQGGTGSDVFYFGKNDGIDTFYNASSSDVINLYDVSINDITSLSIINNQISIGLNIGAQLQINSSENVSAKITMQEGSVNFNHSTNQWQLV